jgi:hypothetical protein
MKTGGNTGSEFELLMDGVTAAHDAAVRWIRVNDPAMGCSGKTIKLGPSVNFRGGIASQHGNYV